jgi:hypothetical protein
MVEARGGVYYSDPTDTMRGSARAQERKLDIAVPSWPDIDARIQAFVETERQRFDELLETKLDEHDDIWREVIAQVIVKLIDEKPGPQGPPGPAGKLPSIRVWKAGQVAYEDQVFNHEGACYQALRDTGQEPGGTDWVQIARAGRDGIIPQLRGTYDATACYKKFDICALNGSSFVARKDDPGECPGAGWQLHASAGRTGGRGERGEQGPRGLQGPKGDPVSITGWEIDAASYTATPVLSGGQKGPPLELRDLFKQFIADTR